MSGWHAAPAPSWWAAFPDKIYIILLYTRLLPDYHKRREQGKWTVAVYSRQQGLFLSLCAQGILRGGGAAVGHQPASFLYNWAIYAGVVLLWACFAAASEWKRFWKTVFHPAMLLSFVWPVLLFVYALAEHVEFPFHHLLMPIFYLLFWFYVSLPDRFAMKLLTFVTTAYYLLINAGTVLALAGRTRTSPACWQTATPPSPAPWQAPSPAAFSTSIR